MTPFIYENNDDKNQNKKTIIFLKLHVERSTVHPDVVSTIINKSEANSFIQLYNGEETLIAGLYSTEKNVLRKGIPILKDLPWWFLGFPYIFGYNSIEKVEKELVIIIKATLLKNVHDREKISSSEVLNLKKSLVDGSDLKFRSQPSNQQQLVMNTNKKIQATNISVLADDSNGKNKPELHPAKQVNKNLKEPTSSNFTFGKIKKIKNKLALIEWFKMCEADKLFGKQLPVVRKDDTKQKVEFVGIVKIIETRNNCSVGKKIRNNKKFKIGDYLVIQQ